MTIILHRLNIHDRSHTCLGQDELHISPSFEPRWSCWLPRESSRRSRLGLDFRASGALSPAVAGVIVRSSLQVRYRQSEPDNEGQKRLKILLLASFQLISGVGGRVHVFLSPHKEMAFELQEHEEKESSTSARHYDLCPSRFVDRRHPTRQGRPGQEQEQP